jgi:hypothetical protein
LKPFFSAQHGGVRSCHPACHGESRAAGFETDAAAVLQVIAMQSIENSLFCKLLRQILVEEAATFC